MLATGMVDVSFETNPAFVATVSVRAPYEVPFRRYTNLSSNLWLGHVYVSRFIELQLPSSTLVWHILVYNADQRYSCTVDLAYATGIAILLFLALVGSIYL